MDTGSCSVRFEIGESQGTWPTALYQYDSMGQRRTGDRDVGHAGDRRQRPMRPIILLRLVTMTIDRPTARKMPKIHRGAVGLRVSFNAVSPAHLDEAALVPQPVRHASIVGAKGPLVCARDLTQGQPEFEEVARDVGRATVIEAAIVGNQLATEAEILMAHEDRRRCRDQH